MLKALIQLFIKQTGRKPNAIELLKLKFKAASQSGKGKVIEFPKERITPFYKPRPGEGVANTKQRILQIDDELDNLSTKEGKYAKMSRNDREDLMIKLQDESSTLQEKTLFKDSPEAIAKIKADNKAAMERLRKKKMEERSLEDFTDDFTDDPEGLASGGLARVGMFGGGPIRLAKGASWVINKLKEQLFDLDLGIGGSRFSKLSSTQKEGFKNELKTLIKQLEQGGEIPNEMLDTMIADPKFKSVVKTRSTDKDLFELEDALLDRQAGKQSDELFGADGKLNKKAVLQEVKDSEEKMLLDRFNVKDRKPNASGGLAHILGV